LQTIGVLGHGLDRIYPQENKSTAKKMLENGGLFAEFESETRPDRENFPQRNRIVAGMVDAVIVVETANKGGSMITAKLAAGYNRDVFAYPGPVDAPFSEGCNHLIKSHQANLIEGVKDLEYLLGWDMEENKPVQKQLFVDLNGDEKIVFDLLNKQAKTSLDNLSIAAEMPTSKVSMLLLELEFKGLVQSMPGKMFAAV
jgi:DNA processing protein